MGSIYSQETEKYVSQGDKALSNGFYDVALNNYLKALEINSKHKKAYKKIIEIVDSVKWKDNVGIELYPDACETIKSYMSNCNSTNANFYIKMGEFFIDYDNNDYSCVDSELAFVFFEKAIKLNPKSAKAYHRMGKVYNEEKYYLKALEIDPSFYDALSNLTFKYIYAEEYTKAIICCQNAIKKDPNFIYAYERMGIAYFNKGCYSHNKEDYIKSIKSFQKAKEIVIKTDKKSVDKVSRLNSYIADPTHNLALIYFDEEDYNNAKNCYNNLIGYFNEAYFKLGVCYFFIEEYSKAISSFKKYILLL